MSNEYFEFIPESEIPNKALIPSIWIKTNRGYLRPVSLPVQDVEDIAAAEEYCKEALPQVVLMDDDKQMLKVIEHHLHRAFISGRHSAPTPTVTTQGEGKDPELMLEDIIDRFRQYVVVGQCDFTDNLRTQIRNYAKAHLLKQLETVIPEVRAAASLPAAGGPTSNEMRLRLAVQSFLEIGKRDLTNPKYDGYFEDFKEAVEQSLNSPQQLAGGPTTNVDGGKMIRVMTGMIEVAKVDRACEPQIEGLELAITLLTMEMGWQKNNSSLQVKAGGQSAGVDLIEAAKELIDSMFWLYTAGNGRKMSIQDTAGEKCWIVPADNIERLKAAIHNANAESLQPATTGEDWISVEDGYPDYEADDFWIYYERDGKPVIELGYMWGHKLIKGQSERYPYPTHWMPTNKPKQSPTSPNATERQQGEKS